MSSLSDGIINPRSYATVSDEEGINYRDIADTMTCLGFTMNHSSARNYVLRVMRKFVAAYASEWNIELGECDIDEIAKSSTFQAGVADILHQLWSNETDDNIFITNEKK
jgi:hypothetical protein